MMGRNSLTSKVNPNYRCDRCTIELQHSVWKGFLVCLSLGQKKNTGFKCVKCILSKFSSDSNGKVQQRKKMLVTEEELDQFVKENKKHLTRARDYVRHEIL